MRHGTNPEPTYAKPTAPPNPPPRPAAGLSQLDRIEHKLDTLIAALADDGEGDPPLTSLDGRTFAARDDTKGLG